MPRPTVLIVEDDDDTADAIAELLAARGIDTLRARDGEQAMVVLDNHAIDLILLDLLMPLVSGWEFLAERQRSDRIAKIPVVAVSGSQVALEHTRRDLIDAIVSKPFDSQTLLRVVRRYLPSAD